MPVTRHRAIFISDLHLGSRMTKARELLAFLAAHEADVWYLVGDIYDIKRLRKRAYWPASHGRIIRALRAKARAGDRVVYLPGNHDPELRARPGPRPHLPGIEVRDRIIHVTRNGRRLLVIHGDREQPAGAGAPLPYAGGVAAYFAGIAASEAVARVRRAAGLGYWSLSAALKDRTLPHVPLVARYRDAVLDAARADGADGVICGHIHHATAVSADGLAYFNCGDWVDSCTALVETNEGELRLVRWRGGRAESNTGRGRPAAGP